MERILNFHSGLTFKNLTSSANLNSRNKFEFRFLQIKHLGRRIQEKLHFNKMVSVKSKFLAN